MWSGDEDNSSRALSIHWAAASAPEMSLRLGGPTNEMIGPGPWKVKLT